MTLQHASLPHSYECFCRQLTVASMYRCNFAPRALQDAPTPTCFVVAWQLVLAFLRSKQELANNSYYINTRERT